MQDKVNEIECDYDDLLKNEINIANVLLEMIDKFSLNLVSNKFIEQFLKISLERNLVYNFIVKIFFK